MNKQTRKQLPKYSDFPPGTKIADIMNWIRGEDVRVKGDLQGWTGTPPMHLNREPIKPEKKDAKSMVHIRPSPGSQKGK